MWGDARRMLDQAERLHRQFFELGRSARQPLWEPPVDVFETAEGLFIEVALPGVDAEGVEVSFDNGVLQVVGERNLPEVSEPAVIRRLEIPYGRFERRVRLPAGHYKLARRELVNGCLVLTLRKLG
jgi:HSP20 family molecular chaperone IbpA